MKFETIDDKYLFGNILRHESNEEMLKEFAKIKRKRYFLGMWFNIAFFLLFFSLNVILNSSEPNFLKNIVSDNLRFIFYVYLAFLAIAVYQLVLFVCTFSEFYLKSLNKSFANEFFKSFVKINYTEYSHNLEFENENDFVISKEFKIKTVFKFNFDYRLIIDEEMRKYAFKIGNNLYSKVFYFRDLVGINLHCNGQKINLEASEYSVKELLLQGYLEENEYINSCKDLRLEFVMTQPVQEFMVYYINEKVRVGKKREMGIFDNIDEITKYLLSKI